MPAGQAVSGDYNGDGKTDGADYVTWRNNPGAFGGNPGYTIWRANFGANSGGVTVNNGGTLAVNAGGTGEWTEARSTPIRHRSQASSRDRRPRDRESGNLDERQHAWQSIRPMRGRVDDYTPALSAASAPRGAAPRMPLALPSAAAARSTLHGNNTFSGPLSIAGSGGTLLLTGTNANAGTTMAIPTVGIGSNSTLQLGVSNALPSGTLINTQGPSAQMFLQPTFTQTIRSLSGNNGVVTVQAGATLTIADQAGDNYVFGNGAGTANLRSEDTAKSTRRAPARSRCSAITGTILMATSSCRTAG